MKEKLIKGFEDNLIRLHPSEAGKTIQFNGQLFQGVSPDIFIGLDHYDPSSAYQITRKFNLSLQINPALWSSKDFFKYFTQGKGDGSDPFQSKALELTEKCAIHGDTDSNLHAHNHLTKLLLSPLDMLSDQEDWGFTAGGVDYKYHSIGVAANKGYGPVGTRKTSHFEIKFQRQSLGPSHQEFLCLNIHLSPTQKDYGKEGAIERLTQGIKLFYSELGLLGNKYVPQSNLLTGLSVTLENYASKGFSCQNSNSLKVLESHHEAARHTKSGKNSMNIWDLIDNPSKQAGKEVKLDKRKQKKSRQSVNQNNSFFDVIPDKNKDNVSAPEAIIPSFAT